MGDHVCSELPMMLYCTQPFDSLISVRLQVNYLSTALLSILMLPHLIKSAMSTDASRLVIVSSEAHFLAGKLKGADSWPSILGRLNNEEYCTAS